MSSNLSTTAKLTNVLASVSTENKPKPNLPTLPREIRSMIWNAAIGSRQLYVDMCMGDPQQGHLLSSQHVFLRHASPVPIINNATSTPIVVRSSVPPVPGDYRRSCSDPTIVSSSGSPSTYSTEFPFMAIMLVSRQTYAEVTQDVFYRTNTFCFPSLIVLKAFLRLLPRGYRDQIRKISIQAGPNNNSFATRSRRMTSDPDDNPLIVQTTPWALAIWELINNTPVTLPPPTCPTWHNFRRNIASLTISDTATDFPATATDVDLDDDQRRERHPLPLLPSLETVYLNSYWGTAAPSGDYCVLLYAIRNILTRDLEELKKMKDLGIFPKINKVVCGFELVVEEDEKEKEARERRERRARERLAGQGQLQDSELEEDVPSGDWRIRKYSRVVRKVMTQIKERRDELFGPHGEPQRRMIEGVGPAVGAVASAGSGSGPGSSSGAGLGSQAIVGPYGDVSPSSPSSSSAAAGASTTGENADASAGVDVGVVGLGDQATVGLPHDDTSSPSLPPPPYSSAAAAAASGPYHASPTAPPTAPPTATATATPSSHLHDGDGHGPIDGNGLEELPSGDVFYHLYPEIDEELHHHEGCKFNGRYWSSELVGQSDHEMEKEMSLFRPRERIYFKWMKDRWNGGEKNWPPNHQYQYLM